MALGFGVFFCSGGYGHGSAAFARPLGAMTGYPDPWEDLKIRSPRTIRGII